MVQNGTHQILGETTPRHILDDELPREFCYWLLAP